MTIHDARLAAVEKQAATEARATRAAPVAKRAESSQRIRLAEEILGQAPAVKTPVKKPVKKAVWGKPPMATHDFKKAFAEAAGDDVHVVAGHVKAAAKAAVLSRKIRVARKGRQAAVAKEATAAPAVVPKVAKAATLEKPTAVAATPSAVHPQP